MIATPGIFRISDPSKLLWGIVDQYLAFVSAGWINARQDLHQSRFSGSVLTHQRMKLTRIERKADAVEGFYSRKFLDDVFHFEQRHTI